MDLFNKIKQYFNTIKSGSKNKPSLLKRFKLKASTKKQNARLFFYTDGFQLSAAIIAPKDKRLEILASAQSNQLTEQTLADLLLNLSTQVEQLPEHAIMLHSRMALGLLDLPIADNKALTEDKISNIVRWEMESLYNEQAPQWNIGSLLVQLGIITDLERDHIVETQKQNKQCAASFGGKLPRFGEIVVSQGQLDQTTLEHYLSLQNEMQESDNSLMSGWYKSAQGSTLFCTAMSTQEQYRWIKLFDQNQLRIDRFYPVSGSIAALISPESSQCILELHPNFLVFSLLEKGVVREIEIFNTLERSLSIDDVLNLIQQYDSQIDVFYLWGNHARTEALFEQLKSKISKPLVFVNWPAEKLIETSKFKPDNFLCPLLGVAQDYFYQDLNNGRIPYVIGMPPPPRFYQQKKWQAGIGVSFVLLSLIGTEVYFNQQVKQSQADIDKLSRNYKTLKKNNKELNRDNKRYLKLENKMYTLETEFESLQRQKKAIEENLIERQKFMQAFLPLLIKSIDKDVVLDNLDEVSWYQFRVKGWALNLNAVNRFENALIKHLHGFNMLISKSPSSLMKSGDLAGAYQFDFQLIRDHEKNK